MMSLFKTKTCTSCGRQVTRAIGEKPVIFCPYCLGILSDVSANFRKVNTAGSTGSAIPDSYPDSDYDGIADPYDPNPYRYGGGADGNPYTPG